MRLFFLQLQAVILCAITTLPFQASASSIGATPNAELCNRHFAYYEKIYDIPSNLLKAVSLVESGFAAQKGKSATPWPWAFNAQGKGYFFKSKEEALSAVRTLQRQGTKSIDVGCMQINLYYHPEAFHSLEEAFNPKNNIAYAASFLRKNFDKYNDWKRAIAAYHSGNDTLGNPYAQKVLVAWRNETGKKSVSYASIDRAERRSNSSFSYLSPRMRERRNSNMIVTVHKPSSSVYTKYDAEKVAMVKNITENALHNFNNGKLLQSATFVD